MTNCMKDKFKKLIDIKKVSIFIKKSLKILNTAIKIIIYLITRPVSILMICSVLILILSKYNILYPEKFMIKGKEQPSIIEEEDYIIEDNSNKTTVNDENIIIQIIDIYFTQSYKYKCIKSYDYEGTIIFEIEYKDEDYKYSEHKKEEDYNLSNLHKDIQIYYNKFAESNGSRYKRICLMILDRKNPEVAEYCII